MTPATPQPRHPLEPEQRITLIQPHLPEGVTVEVETGDHQDAWVSANTARHTLLNLEGDVDEAGTDILWHVIESQARAIAALRAQAQALRNYGGGAQAEAEGVWLISWEPGDPYESGGIEDGVWRTEADAEVVRARLEAEERASWAAYPDYPVKTYMLEFRPFALAQAGGES